MADSGVFGLLTHMPEGVTVKNDEWYKIEGTIQSDYYQPFKREIPSVVVTNAESRCSEKSVCVSFFLKEKNK